MTVRRLRIIRLRALLICRFVLLIAGLTAALVGYPPAHGQSRDANGHDEVMQERLKAMEARIDVQDSKIDKQWMAVNAVKESQATMNGEVIGFGALLALLSGAGIVLQVRPKKA